jgi:hypothetical protein
MINEQGGVIEPNMSFLNSAPDSAVWRRIRVIKFKGPPLAFDPTYVKMGKKARKIYNKPHHK